MKKLIFIFLLLAGVVFGAVTETNPSNINFTGQISLSGTGIFTLFQPASSNLSDISALSTQTFGLSLLSTADAAALRASAELGGSALLDVGAVGGTVAAGDDSRFDKASQIWDGSNYVNSANLYDGSAGSVYLSVYAGSATNANYAYSATKAETALTISGTIPSSQVSGLATVASTGSYSSLLGTPTIPTNTNQLTNGAGYITASGTALTISGTIPATQVSGLAAVATTGSFSSLNGKPTTISGYGITNAATVTGGGTVTLSATGSATVTISGTGGTLGSAAYLSTGIAAGTVAAGDDVRLTGTYALWNVARVIQLVPKGFGTSGGGSTGNVSDYAGAGFRVTSGTATGGYARATLIRGVTSLSGFTGAGINFARPIRFAVYGSGGDMTTTSRIRFLVGGNGGVPATSGSDALATRGFGAEIMSESSKARIRLFAHDGTTYSTGSWVDIHTSTSLQDRMIGMIIESDGAGSIKLYLSSGAYYSGSIPTTPTSTLSGGPIIYSGAGEMIDVVAVNDATGTPASSTFVAFQAQLEVR